MTTHLITRCIAVREGQTTVALEPYFWAKLQEICDHERASLPLLIGEIDDKRGGCSRASAIRIFVTEYFWSAAASRFGSPRRNAASEDADLLKALRSDSENGTARSRLRRFDFEPGHE
jgi:predicted DNA-binding ribbon-helix-helix protein